MGFRNLQDEFENYEASVKRLGEESVKMAPPPGPAAALAAGPAAREAVCDICRKTKFADGVGHQCHYCGLKSCARCGGKSMLRANKVRGGGTFGESNEKLLQRAA